VGLVGLCPVGRVFGRFSALGVFKNTIQTLGEIHVFDMDFPQKQHKNIFPFKNLKTTKYLKKG
jgi:hypothetical protein